MSNLNLIELKRYGLKIGYIKINCKLGQLSYSIKECDNGLLFYNLRYHPENIKTHKIIFYNVVPNYMTMYNKQIRDYNESLIKEYFDKNIDEFKTKLSNYGGWFK